MESMSDLTDAELMSGWRPKDGKAGKLYAAAEAMVAKALAEQADYANSSEAWGDHLEEAYEFLYPPQSLAAFVRENCSAVGRVEDIEGHCGDEDDVGPDIALSALLEDGYTVLRLPLKLGLLVWNPGDGHLGFASGWLAVNASLRHRYLFVDLFDGWLRLDIMRGFAGLGFSDGQRWWKWGD